MNTARLAVLAAAVVVSGAAAAPGAARSPARPFGDVPRRATSFSPHPPRAGSRTHSG